MSSKKGHYIVFQHSYMPAPGANTSMKNFGTEGKWRVQEYVYFVDRLKTRHWDSSTVIIDYDNWKVFNRDLTYFIFFFQRSHHIKHVRNSLVMINSKTR